jgi:glutaryl-CoA dehydrogenase
MVTDVAPRHGVDHYLLDELLTNEACGVRDRARAFCEREVIPVAQKYWDRAEFPFALIPKLADTGLVGGAIKG